MANWTIGDWITYVPLILAAGLLALIQLVKDMKAGPSSALSFLMSPKWNYVPLILLILGALSFLVRQWGPVANIWTPRKTKLRDLAGKSHPRS